MDRALRNSFPGPIIGGLLAVFLALPSLAQTKEERWTRLVPKPPLGESSAEDKGALGTGHLKNSHLLREIWQPGEVIGFVGGADIAAAQHTGHLESLLTVAGGEKKLRFRNLGWEGDTVFAQPREIGFPTLPIQLQRAQVSLLFLQFGRSEALNGLEKLPDFVAAYRRLIVDLQSATRKIILITPPPYEKSTSPQPDLSRRNPELTAYSKAIGQLGRELNLPVIDLHTELTRSKHPRLTDNGLQLTPAGQAQVARSLAKVAGWQSRSMSRLKIDETGRWKQASWEQLRQAVVAKNRLWFDYYRPQNWAFLGGDRISQPSSRDHRDPSRRWFPEEMEKFLPLISEAESSIHRLAAQLK